MPVSRFRFLSSLAAALSLIACASDDPSPAAATTVTVPTAVTSIASVPTPRPTPPPCSVGLCEGETVNTAPPTKVDIRLYWVLYPGSAAVAPNCTADSAIPIGYTFAIDLSAKDADNRPTNGESRIVWRYDGTDRLVEIGNAHVFQPKHKVLAGGTFRIQGTLDGVESNWIEMTLGGDPRDTACGNETTP